MRRTELLVMSFFILAISSVPGQTKEQKQPSPTDTTVSSTDNHERGQQVFEQNCSRCHNAPEGFSNHISGTIARHMRVRASLNDADYKALLRFLNP